MSKVKDKQKKRRSGKDGEVGGVKRWMEKEQELVTDGWIEERKRKTITFSCFPAFLFRL